MNGTEMRASLVVTADANSVVLEGRRAAEAWREFRREMGTPVNTPNTPVLTDPGGAARQEMAERTARANRALATEQASVTRAMRESATASGQTARALDAVAKSAEESAQVFNAALDREEQAMRDLAGSLDPVLRAMTEFEAAQRRVSDAVADGVLTEAEAARMLDQLTSRYDAFVASSRTNPSAGSARASASVFESNWAEQDRASESARIFGDYEKEQADAAARAFRALEESINPLIRAERELAEAQEVVNRALAQGQITNTTAARSLSELERRYETIARAQSPAAQSAAAFERALEEQERSVRQLMLAVDPAARALQEMELAQEQLTRAVRAGIITQEEATRTLGLLEARQRQVGAGGTTMAMGVQNASFQMTDFIVQVQAGQSASLALAQQLPQLLGGFGALGAVLGLGVALGVPLVTMLFNIGDAAGSLDDRIQRLETSLSSVNDRLAILRNNDLARTFGNMAGTVRTLTQELLKLDRAAELKNLRQTLDGLMKENIKPGFWQGALASYLDTGPVQGASAARDLRLRQENYQELTGGRGISYQDFDTRRTNIDALAKAGEVEKVTAEVGRLIRDMAAGGPLTEMNSDLTEMLITMGDLAIKTAEVEAEFNGSALAARTWASLSEAGATAWARIAETGRARAAEGAERIRVAQNELSLAQVIGTYGEQSNQAEAERARIARENYELELTRAGIFEGQRDRLMEIYDQTVSTEAATASWATRMADVGAELSGILGMIANLGGGMVDRAAKNAELKALQGGATIADAAERGTAVRRDAQYAQRSAALGGGLLGRTVAGAERWWSETGDAQDAALAEARAEARRREAKARREGGGGGNGLSAVSSIKDEIARLKPSYDADIAAAEAWRDKALASLAKGKEGYGAFADDVELIFKERVAKAYEADLARRDDWAAGIERANLQLEEDMTSWADLSESLVEGFAQSGEDAFAKWFATGKASISDFTAFVIEAFARMAYQTAIMPGLQSIMNAVLGGIMPTVTGGATVTTHHTGSPGVMRSYALASYGDTPRPDESLTMMKDGEQIMTSRALENAGAMISAMAALASRPVQVAGGGGTNIQFVNNGTPQKVDRIEEGTDSRGQRQQKLFTSDLVGEALTTPGGGGRRAMKQTYGIGVPGRRRQQ